MSDALQPETRQALQPTGVGSETDEGYMLLGLIVAIALILLWLSAAATSEAFAIKRDREAETARRADQYVRAIRLYYKKFGHYPGSVEQLEKSNNIRFLRKRWEDPLTKTTDWRMISVGQNQTTPKGFFGEPLTGLASTGLGALSGSQSSGMPGPGNPLGGSSGPGSPPGGSLGATPAGAPAGAAPGGFGTTFGSPIGAPSGPGGVAAPAGGAPGVPGVPTAAPGAPGSGAAAAGTGTGSNSTSSPFGSSNGLGGTNGAIMGVGTNATGNSILEINEQTTYQSWEFLYDPRVELLKQKQQLNQGLQTSGAGSFGQAPGSTAPGTTTPGAANPSGGTPGVTAPPSGPGTAPTIGVPVQP
jgi:type II secretory pathway pseudopilin PulG